jgi:hypothetical protein
VKPFRWAKMAEILGEDNPGKIHILFVQINRQIKGQADWQKERQREKRLIDGQVDRQKERQINKL